MNDDIDYIPNHHKLEPELERFAVAIILNALLLLTLEPPEIPMHSRADWWLPDQSIPRTTTLHSITGLHNTDVHQMLPNPTRALTRWTKLQNLYVST